MLIAVVHPVQVSNLAPVRFSQSNITAPSQTRPRPMKFQSNVILTIFFPLHSTLWCLLCSAVNCALIHELLIKRRYAQSNWTAPSQCRQWPLQSNDPLTWLSFITYNDDDHDHDHDHDHWSNTGCTAIWTYPPFPSSIFDICCHRLSPVCLVLVRGWVCIMPMAQWSPFTGRWRRFSEL